jgi:hypothetical protein
MLIALPQDGDPIWLRGYPTQGLVDGDGGLQGLYLITGTTKYNTVAGGAKTVPLSERIPLDELDQWVELVPWTAVYRVELGPRNAGIRVRGTSHSEWVRQSSVSCGESQRRTIGWFSCRIIRRCCPALSRARRRASGRWIGIIGAVRRGTEADPDVQGHEHRWAGLSGRSASALVINPSRAGMVVVVDTDANHVAVDG